MAVYLDSLVTKPSFRKLHEMEPDIISQEGEAPKDFIEGFEVEIAKCEQKTRLMRLITLLALTGELSKDSYPVLIREYVAAFGVSEYLRIMNMERAGMLRRKEPMAWKTMKETFNLVVPGTSTAKPTDISYAYNGYAPLSVRLIEKLLENGWNSSESNLYAVYKT